MLAHDNGKPVVEIYGQWRSSNSSSGPTVAFNIYDCDGSPIGYDEVSRLATLNCPPIQLRTGCFCNPGACQQAILLTNNDLLHNYASGHVCGDRKGVLNDKPTGAVRVSLGKDSIWEDVDSLVTFIEKVFVAHHHLSKSQSKCNTTSPDANIYMKIDSLFVFPIKSCHAMKVKRWPVSQYTKYGHTFYSDYLLSLSIHRLHIVRRPD